MRQVGLILDLIFQSNRIIYMIWNNNSSRYRVFINGELIEEPNNISSFWRDDLVTFIIGCSFSFEEALMNAGLPVRHIEMNTNVPMYHTNIPCASAGVFS